MRNVPRMMSQWGGFLFRLECLSSTQTCRAGDHNRQQEQRAYEKYNGDQFLVDEVDLTQSCIRILHCHTEQD